MAHEDPNRKNSPETAQDTDDAGHRLDERGERRHENDGGHPQHARKGQAQSPVDETHHEPPKKREGHK
jgi:hypothetical protein